MSGKRILVDCDGVLADFLSDALKIINRKTKRKGKDRFTEDHITQWDICGSVGMPHLWSEINKAASRKGFCRKIKPYEHAKDGIALLRSAGEVFVVTSPLSTPHWTYERGQWLDEHFSVKKTHVIHTDAKHVVVGDTLIDDKLDNCINWAKHHPDGVALIWDATYNRKTPDDLPENVHRVKSWEEVLGFLSKE